MSEDTIVLRGRGIVGGVAEGEALVTTETISGWGGVSPMDGKIIETRHELRGQSFKDKVLVFRGAKGSSGWSVMFHTCRLAGTAPKAMIFNEMTTKVALGAVVMRVPSVTGTTVAPMRSIQKTLGRCLKTSTSPMYIVHSNPNLAAIVAVATPC